MLNLRIPPKNPEELYEFFMHIANPPVKSHVAYDKHMYFFIRENWSVDGYLSKSSNLCRLWFRYNESDPARWYEIYEKYIQTKE